MKREDLKTMGLTDEQIEKVMAENGKDITAEQAKVTAKAAELEQANTQLTEANKQIEGFKSMDVDGIKAAAEKYKADFEKAQADHKAELDKITYNSTAEKFIDSLKPKDGLSRSAILSEFTKKEFKLDGENFQGAKEWAETFKKDNAAHFADGDDGSSTSVSSGVDHGNALPGDLDKFAAAAMKGAGIQSESK